MNTNTEKTCHSEIAAALHELISDVHDARVISRATLRSFDEFCQATAYKACQFSTHPAQRVKGGAR